MTQIGDLPVFIPTRGAANRLKTHHIIEDAIYVVHNEEQRESVRRITEGRYTDIIIHGIAEHDLCSVRDWIETNLVTGKDIYGNSGWYAGADDNIERLERVIDEYYDDEDAFLDSDEIDRDDFRHQITSSREVQRLFFELATHAEQIDTNYAGFGWMENPFFRKKKWQEHGYVKSKLFVKKRDGSPWRWDPAITLMHDHSKTFDTIARLGKVLINHWVYAHHVRWEEGGNGSYEERKERRYRTCTMLYERFAGLVNFPSEEKFDEPRLCRRGQISIDRWRKEHGYIKDDISNGVT